MRVFIFVASLIMASVSMAQSSAEREVAEVLNQYHQAAADGDWNTYFDLMSEDGVFLGTDVGERWTKEVFRRYAGNRSGWVYVPRLRHINFTPDGNSAWFDEVLDSASYGTSRGTGVLIRTSEGWKISQYHLTFPIPNELAREVTDMIKALEAQ